MWFTHITMLEKGVMFPGYLYATPLVLWSLFIAACANDAQITVHHLNFTPTRQILPIRNISPIFAGLGNGVIKNLNAATSAYPFFNIYGLCIAGAKTSAAKCQQPKKWQAFHWYSWPIHIHLIWTVRAMFLATFDDRTSPWQHCISSKKTLPLQSISPVWVLLKIA